MKNKSLITIIFIIILIFLIYGFLMVYLIKFGSNEETNIIFEQSETINNVVIMPEQNIEKENINNLNMQIENPFIESTNQINTSQTQIKKLNHKYYYINLDQDEQFVYEKLENSIENLKTGRYDVNISSKFQGLLEKENGMEELEIIVQNACAAFLYDYPEVFYIDLNKVYLNVNSETRGSNTTYTANLSNGENSNYFYDYFQTEEQVRNCINNLEQVKSEVLRNANGDIYDKILYIHDYLCNNVTYDVSESNSNRYNIYGALIDGNVVCEGYAKAFKYLLEGFNIPSILVIGDATNSSNETENHMWNYVQINNLWYGVDVTWDDPINSSETLHKYYLKGSSVFNKQHRINGVLNNGGKNFPYPSLIN